MNHVCGIALILYFIGNCLISPLNTVIVVGVVRIGGQECPPALFILNYTKVVISSAR